MGCWCSCCVQGHSLCEVHLKTSLSSGVVRSAAVLLQPLCTKPHVHARVRADYQNGVNCKAFAFRLDATFDSEHYFMFTDNRPESVQLTLFIRRHRGLNSYWKSFVIFISWNMLTDCKASLVLALELIITCRTLAREGFKNLIGY